MGASAGDDGLSDARFETLINLLRASKSIDIAEMQEAMEQSKALANDIKDILDLLMTDNDAARLKALEELSALDQELGGMGY